jgi:small membrane protein
MNLFQWVFVPLCVALALQTALRVWYRRMPRRWGTLVAAGWLLAAWLIAYPTSTFVVAQRLGIGRGTDLVMYLAVLSGLFAAGYFYNRYRRLEVVVTELVRRDALSRAQQGGQPGTADNGEPAEARRATPAE